MLKNQIVNAKIYLSVEFKDTFPSDWDEDKIIEFIKKNFEDYVEDYELEDVSVLSTDIDNYGEDIDNYGEDND